MQVFQIQGNTIQKQDIVKVSWIHKRIQLISCLFIQLTGCIAFAYSICMSSLFINRANSNQGSFMVSYGYFLALLWGNGISNHFNGAISLAYLIKRQPGFSFLRFLAYSFTQFLGFLLGGLLAWGLEDRVLTPRQKGTDFMAQNFFAQIFSTFIFTFYFVYMNDKKLSPLKDSTIGKNLFFGLILFINRTWAFRTQCLNPTLALGLSLAAGFHNSANWQYWKYIWVIIIAPYIGAALSALYFKKAFTPFVIRWRQIKAMKKK